MKKLILSVAVYFLTLCAHSLSLSDFSLSVEPFFELKNGNLGEYLYTKSSLTDSDLISYLEWDESNIAVLGLKVNGGWKKLTTSLSFSFAPNQSSGSMADSDWVNIEQTSLSTYQYKTNYTESSNFIDSALFFQTTAGYTFDTFSFCSITPFFGFEYNIIDFTAKGLSGSYGNKISGEIRAPYNSSNSTAQYRSDDTVVITYKRYSQIFWLGTTFTFPLPHAFQISTGFQIAPFINTISYDHHLLKADYYADACSAWFAAAKLSLSLSYSPVKDLDLILSGSLFHAKEIRGSTYKSYNSGSSYVEETGYNGGASQKEYTVSLSLRYTIF